MQTNSTDENTPSTKTLRCCAGESVLKTETRSCSSFANRCRELSPDQTYFNKRMQTSLVAIYFVSLTLTSMLACVASVPVTSNCDPTDPSSCGFSSVCKRQNGNQFSQISEKPIYRCTCPKINCYREGFYEPICGAVGGVQKQFFNILCLMLEECDRQEPVTELCYGSCGSSNCKAIVGDTNRHGRCARQKSSLCLNGGLCVHHFALNESYCRCPASYQGNRCELKILKTGVKPQESCDNWKNAFIAVSVIFLVVLLLGIFFCVCSRLKTSKNKASDLWKNTEEGETTPLRDGGRSDFIYPSRSRLSGNSEQ